MGQRDDQPDLGIEMTAGDAQQSLKGITEELEQLKHSLVQQLSQEIEQLQERKTKLMAETEALDQQREAQLAQQQELAQQLAPAIAEQLLTYLQTNDLATDSEANLTLGNGSLQEYNDNANRLITSLDSTLRTTFRTLQQDVSSYQSTLSQQLGQMYSLEQQAQVILEALVSRIRAELQSNGRDSTFTTPIRPPQTYDQGQPVIQEQAPELPPIQEVRPPQRQPIARPAPKAPTAKPEKKKVSVSQIQLGFILVLASSLLLSFQNVVISIILNVSSLFGFWETGGYISPSFGNSLLILFLRMLVVVPLMAVLAQFLYPSSWQEIGRFLKSGDRVAFGYVIGCGFFLFASSALIYMALGALNPGVALTLFFVFPIVTVVCAWLFFGDRPSIVRWGATFTVFLGIVLIAFPKDGAGSLSALGVSTAIGAGVTFAFHVLLIQSCTKRLHPVPFSVINFGVILIFSFVSLLIPLPTTLQIAVEPDQVWNLLVSGLVLGGLTLLSYLTNNIGISHIGAARASIIGATGPALTSLMAWIIIGRPLTGLQLFGMLVVTAGVLGQNLERFFKKPTPKKS